MLHSRSNGQSIVDYIPPHLRNMFFNNPAAIHASQNGLDPYGFSTNGLVLYLPLWALKDSAYQSVDASRMTCTATADLWTPNGADFNSATPDYIEIPASYTQLDFTSGDFSIIARIYVDDLSLWPHIFNRGTDNTDGYHFYLSTTGHIYVRTFQAAATQTTKSAAGEIVVSNWYTVGLSRTGTSIKVFKNGVDVSATSGTHTDPATSSKAARIGIDPSDTYKYDGKIQDLFVYSGALSAGEHLDTHNRLKWRD